MGTPATTSYEDWLSLLTFSESDHKYTLRDPETGQSEVIASTTQMISSLGLIDTSRFTQKHRTDGSRRHLATELDDQGILDEASLDDITRPAVEQWRQFRHDSGFGIEHIEVRAFSPSLRYGATLDRVGILNGRRTILDIKGSASLPTYSLQLWLYKMAWEEIAQQEIEQLVSVHLRPKGRYRLATHYSKGITPDDAAASAAAGIPHVFQWRTNDRPWDAEVRESFHSLCRWSKEALDGG